MPLTSGVGVHGLPQTPTLSSASPPPVLVFELGAWIQGLPAAGTCVFLAQVWAASQGVFVAGLGVCAVHGQHSLECPAASRCLQGRLPVILTTCLPSLPFPRATPVRKGWGQEGTSACGRVFFCNVTRKHLPSGSCSGQHPEFLHKFKIALHTLSPPVTLIY